LKKKYADKNGLKLYYKSQKNMCVCARVFEGSVEKEVYLTIKVITYIVSILCTKKR